MYFGCSTEVLRLVLRLVLLGVVQGVATGHTHTGRGFATPVAPARHDAARAPSAAG